MLSEQSQLHTLDPEQRLPSRAGFPSEPTWGAVRGRGWRPPGEALNRQTLASLFSPPCCPAFGVNALFDSIPVRFCDSKFIEKVTWKDKSQTKAMRYRPSSYTSTVWDNLNTEKGQLLRAHLHLSEPLRADWWSRNMSQKAICYQRRKLASW
jgi:hypothetical protein